VAVREAVRKVNQPTYGIIAWDYVTTEEAVALVAQGWDETVRIKPKDDAAWFEALEVERRLDRLWKDCDLLWIDDLHIGATNMNFIERHLFPRLESRVKHGLATVVSTSLEARHLAHLEPVVKDLFVMVKADRAVR
jgi:DNA replication protein DnaC